MIPKMMMLPWETQEPVHSQFLPFRGHPPALNEEFSLPEPSFSIPVQSDIPDSSSYHQTFLNDDILVPTPFHIDYADCTTIAHPSLDTDADGLSDGIEARGWEIHVINGATGEEKEVILASESHSNPARFDPAGWRWDTRSRDTDGDGLGDYAEFENMSCPTRWDTDMDKPADLYEADGQQSITDMMPPVISKIEADYWTVYEYNLPKELKVRVKYTVQDNNGLARVEVECEGLGALETGYDGETGDIKGDETFTTDVQHTFWSGYKFKVRAYDTAGNGAERPAEVKNIWARALDLLLGELVKLVKWLFNMLFGWLYDLIKTFFNQVIKPVFDVAKDSINKLLTVFKESFTFGSVHLATSAFLITYYTTFASLVILQAIFAFGIVLMVIESLVKGLSGGISSAVGTLTTKIGGYLKTLIISTLLVGFAAGFTISTEGDSDTATAPLKAAVPKNIDLIFGATFGIMDLIAAVAPALLLKEGLLRTLEIPAVGNVLKAFLISGVASLILLFIDEGISEIIEGTMPQLFIKFVFDSILLAILIHVVHPLIGSAKDPLMEATKTILPIFYLISETMSWISIVIVGSHLLWVITDGIQNKLETMG